MSLFQVSEKERKLALDLSYIKSVVSANPQVQTSDILLFFQKAQLVGADPRLDQIFLLPFRHNAGSYNQANQWVDNWVLKASTVFSYHFFLQKAESSKTLLGWSIETATKPYFNPAIDKTYDTLCSTVTIEWKEKKPSSYTAWFPEFLKKKRNGDPTKAWAERPHLMLDKCSLTNGMRQGNPLALSGMVTLEESQGFESISEARETPEAIEGASELPKTPQERETAAKAETHVTQAQLTRLYTIVGNNDWTRENLHSMIKKIWSYTTTKQLKPGQYDYCCKKVEAMGFAEWASDFDTAKDKNKANF